VFAPNRVALNPILKKMQELVKLTIQDGVAVITIDNPPVNALGPGVPEGLQRGVEEANRDPGARAIVIIGAGKTFPAGADIKELEAVARGMGPRGGPGLHDLLASIEDSPKPVVMALHGNILGGGLELAMAGHYRVARPDARIGQPEVNLGIIPGAEGTQRLPRLVGVKAAVEMCVSGRPIPAPEALELGLVDTLSEDDLLAGALAFTRKILRKASHPKTRERNEKLGSAESSKAFFEAGRQQAAKIRRNQTAPLRVLEALEAAVTLPFAEGCVREREIAAECLASDQCRAMIHAFFAERGVAKVPDIPPDTPTREIRQAALVGAGTMGAGISMALANAGIPVRLKDVDQSAIDRGMASIRKNYDRSVQRGRLDQEEADRRMGLIRGQLTFDGFDAADLVIEAVFEDLDLKKRVFKEIDAVAQADCVLGSNTSTLDIDQIASTTSRPESVIGLHFFSPAHVMRLLEIVRGAETSRNVVATALGLARKLRKVGVVVGNCRGFVGNRMMLPYMREAQFLVEEGATPSQVDAALFDFGMAMGIFAVDDMGGIDVQWRARQEAKHLEPPDLRRPLVLDKLYAMKRLGQKTGAPCRSRGRGPHPRYGSGGRYRKARNRRRGDRRTVHLRHDQRSGPDPGRGLRATGGRHRHDLSGGLRFSRLSRGTDVVCRRGGSGPGAGARTGLQADSWQAVGAGPTARAACRAGTHVRRLRRRAPGAHGIAMSLPMLQNRGTPVVEPCRESTPAIAREPDAF
jgi:3-hydroxyacyl-CoA dehydrogenase